MKRSPQLLNDAVLYDGKLTIDSGIYLIKNTFNDRFYIGSSKHFAERWVEHREMLKNNHHANSHLQNAWNKYGAEHFTFNIIEQCKNIDLLLVREQIFLDMYFDNGKECYNENPIATKPPSALGKKRTIETRQKISKANRGKSLHPEHKLKISITNTGRKMSAEQRIRMSEGRRGAKNPFYNKKHTYETKDKIKLARKAQITSNKNKKFSGQAKNNMSLAHIGKKALNRKLTDEQVREIKKSLINGESGALIANKFNVSRSTISEINTGKTYSDVK